MAALTITISTATRIKFILPSIFTKEAFADHHSKAVLIAYCFDFLKQQFILFILKDLDCLICFKSHASSVCPDRKPEHCADCHVFIVQTSDHTSVCGLKKWSHKNELYGNLVAKPLQERVILNFSSAIRVLKDGNWRKGEDGMELCSSTSGAVFRFKTRTDLCLLSVSYAPVRIVVVVKDDANEEFREKLMLLTSPQRMMVATELDREFDRNAPVSKHTTLVIAVAQTGLVIDVNLFGRTARISHQLVYREDGFDIPEELNVATITPGVMGQQVQNAVVLRTAVRPDAAIFCSACYRVHRTNECGQRPMDRCPECHVAVITTSHHDKACNLKWFTSTAVDVYVKFPVTRCIVTMKSAIYWQHDNQLEVAYQGLVLASPMGDVYFKFISDCKFELMTTGFTRIRVPIVVHETTKVEKEAVLNEKLILLTSHDRTLVAAMGSRQVTLETVFDDAFLHNNPLVLHNSPDSDPSLFVKVYGVNNREMSHLIPYKEASHKFEVPDQIDVRSTKFLPFEFDAAVPKKKKK